MMKIDYYMNKLKHYSFKREQLDIIDKYDLLESNITKWFCISFFILLILLDTTNNEIINTLLSIAIGLETISYIFFLLFRKRFILKLLRSSIDKDNIN